MLEQLSDERLMSSFINPNDINHHRAFEILYQRHKGPMYGFITRSLNNAEDANEVFQDAWFKIINHKDTFDPQRKFTTWAYTIIRRLLIDYYRKQPDSGTETNFDEALSETSEDPIKQPDNDLERQQMTQQLHQTIGTLPMSQRQAFVLRHGSGFSLPEVARITDQPQEQTKSQYRYAVQKIKQALERLK